MSAPWEATGEWSGGLWRVQSILHEDGTADTDVRIQKHGGPSRRMGFGGPLLHPGLIVNGYVGRKPGLPVVVLARMAPAEHVRTAVDGEDHEAVWTRDADGVTYLFDLLDDSSGPGLIEVTGTREGRDFRVPLIG